MANSLKASFVLLLITMTVGMGYANAEQQVNVPLPFDAPFVHMNCWTQVSQGGGVGEMLYHCIWNWFIEPDTATEIERIMEEKKDPVNDELFIKDLVKKNPLIIPEVEEIPEEDIEPDVAIPIEPQEPLNKEEREIKAAVDTLAECRTGLGAWAAYQEQELIQNYADKTRWEFSIRDNLSQSYAIKQILLAIEECDIMKKYAQMNLIGAYELNKVLADLAGVDYLGRGAQHPLAVDETDISDSSIYTDPVTPKDLAKEVAESERIFASLFKDPNAPRTGINRGGQTLGAACQAHGQPYQVETGFSNEQVCPLDNYNRLIIEQADTITYSDIRVIQCENYFPIYAHKVGTEEFPNWLEHCLEGTPDEKLCFIGREQVHCDELQ